MTKATKAVQRQKGARFLLGEKRDGEGISEAIGVLIPMMEGGSHWEALMEAQGPEAAMVGGRRGAGCGHGRGAKIGKPGDGTGQGCSGTR